MKSIVISLLMFIFCMFLLLASFQMGIPFGFVKVAPFLLMICAMLMQWTSLTDYKNILSYKNSLLEKTKQESDLQSKIETQAKQILAQEKQYTEEKEKLRKDIETLQSHLQTTQSDLQKYKTQALSQDALTLLSLLQEKGRFLDFLMDDIRVYTDEQVGAAGRIVHQGCSKVLSEFFNISPLHAQEEGAVVKLGHEDLMSAYRILGNHVEQLPLSAKIVHKGWGTDKVCITRRSTAPVELSGKMMISPVEVEVLA